MKAWIPSPHFSPTFQHLIVIGEKPELEVYLLSWRENEAVQERNKHPLDAAVSNEL